MRLDSYDKPTQQRVDSIWSYVGARPAASSAPGIPGSNCWNILMMLRKKDAMALATTRESSIVTFVFVRQTKKKKKKKKKKKYLHRKIDEVIARRPWGVQGGSWPATKSGYAKSDSEPESCSTGSGITTLFKYVTCEMIPLSVKHRS